MQLYDCQVGLQIDDGADSNITNTTADARHGARSECCSSFIKLKDKKSTQVASFADTTTYMSQINKQEVQIWNQSSSSNEAFHHRALIEGHMLTYTNVDDPHKQTTMAQHTDRPESYLCFSHGR